MELFADFFPSSVHVFMSDRPANFAQSSPRVFSDHQEQCLASLDFLPRRIVNVRQVHGTRIVDVGGDCPRGQMLEDADALITSLPDVSLAIRTADCLPVFIYDPVSGWMANIHAGWKGSQLGIAAKVVDRLCHDARGEPGQFLVGLGPCIRSCCYEVGPEFRPYFPKAISVRGESFYLDLLAVNREQLMGRGIKKEHIREAGPCTCCDQRFFSYRREGDKAGRHLCLMWKEQG